MPPKCAVGRNVRGEGCDHLVRIRGVETNVVALAREQWLPAIYDSVADGCLEDMEWGEEMDASEIRREMLELLTETGLYCSANSEHADCERGAEAYVAGTVRRLNAMVYLCKENNTDEEYENDGKGLLGHELLHIVLHRLDEIQPRVHAYHNAAKRQCWLSVEF